MLDLYSYTNACASTNSGEADAYSLPFQNHPHLLFPLTQYGIWLQMVSISIRGMTKGLRVIDTKTHTYLFIYTQPQRREHSKADNNENWDRVVNKFWPWSTKHHPSPTPTVSFCCQQGLTLPNPILTSFVFCRTFLGNAVDRSLIEHSRLR
jgi:hypothetical protein